MIYRIRHGGLYLQSFDIYSSQWTGVRSAATTYSEAEAQAVAFALNASIVSENSKCN